LLGLTIFLGLPACAPRSPAEREYAAALARDRTEKDTFFASPAGPLTPEQRASFAGLRYFPPSLRWRVTARLEPVAGADTLQFPTSQATFDQFVRAGTLRFDFDGRSHALQLFRAPSDDHWFLPFTDATSARTTYGAGRYLEVVIVPGEPVELDFNRAYNPYCAYNAHWICPLAPPENRLALSVEAGEKSYHDDR
jgi:hypothetical protein